jgi:hypothetical protein
VLQLGDLGRVPAVIPLREPVFPTLTEHHDRRKLRTVQHRLGNDSARVAMVQL